MTIRISVPLGETRISQCRTRFFRWGGKNKIKGFVFVLFWSILFWSIDGMGWCRWGQCVLWEEGARCLTSYLCVSSSVMNQLTGMLLITLVVSVAVVTAQPQQATRYSTTEDNKLFSSWDKPLNQVVKRLENKIDTCIDQEDVGEMMIWSDRFLLF